MEKAVLDTDIYSEILRAKNPKVVRLATAYRVQFGKYTLSSPTVVELVHGLQLEGRSKRCVELVEALESEEILALDHNAAVTAGKISGELTRTGQPIGRIDPMIAAIALHHRLTLVTGNAKHFQRIVDLGYPLQLTNWRE